MTPTAYRSPFVTALIQRTEQAPTLHEPANDLTPYIPEGEEEDRALASLGLERPSHPRRSVSDVIGQTPLAGLMLIGLGAAVWSALGFFLDMLERFGAPA